MKAEIIYLCRNARWTMGKPRPINSTEITPVDIAIVSVDGEIRWMDSVYKDEWIVRHIEDGMETYPMPKGWGEAITPENLPYWEEEFVKTMGKSAPLVAV